MYKTGFSVYKTVISMYKTEAFEYKTLLLQKGALEGELRGLEMPESQKPLNTVTPLLRNVQECSAYGQSLPFTPFPGIMPAPASSM